MRSFYPHIDNRPSTGPITPTRLVMVAGMGILYLMNHTPAATEAAVPQIVEYYTPNLVPAAPAPQLQPQPPRAQAKASSSQEQRNTNCFDEEINYFAHKYGMPAHFVKIITWLESRCNPNTPASYAGAEGIMQVMPGTQEEIKGKLGITGEVDMWDPVQGIEFGTFYLRGLYDQLTPGQAFTPDVARIVAAGYHGGAKDAKRLIAAGMDYAKADMGPRTTQYSYSAGRMWEDYVESM